MKPITTLALLVSSAAVLAAMPVRIAAATVRWLLDRRTPSNS